ncbi:uncharacterized protein BXZ73DRAFT_40667, partial [Epithele typhae]|uniref:uncharacterized protein n=1 Tax=Epithele typhae TaxID=378194 RepID=UPI0020076743
SVVREINKINEKELELDSKGSWHDEYKDSAYIFVGGLPRELTEGDVITIFSQYGEIMDVNLPRDKETGKPKGFGFLMYEDQRSTVLAVDNLNGAKVLDRTLRVDHVKNYKQSKTKGEDGEWVEPEDQSLNAKPQMLVDEDEAFASSASSGPEIDPEDPMRDYLIAKRKEEKAVKKGKKSKSKKNKDETPEERRARKERKKLRKEKGKSEGVKGVEDLLNSLGVGGPRRRSRSASPRRSRSRTPPAHERERERYGRKGRDGRDIDDRQDRHSPRRRHSREHSLPPRRARSPTPPSRPRDTRNGDGDRQRDRDAPPRATRRGYD